MSAPSSPGRTGDDDDHNCSESSPENFQHQCQRLPPEICSIIMKMMFEDAFGPRTVYPQRDRTVKNIFLALDKTTYRKQYELYWSSNKWVIGKGSVMETMRFMSERPYNLSTADYSRHRPNKAALTIQNVELCFSEEDTPSTADWLPPVEPEQENVFVPTSNHVLEEFERRSEQFKLVAIRTWQDKFDRVAVLNLRNLTLDLREAYGLNGEYLGLRAVQGLIPFAHGIPNEFRILAPSEELVEQVRGIFNLKNSYDDTSE